MLRRVSARRVLPKRDGWHGLQQFAVAEPDVAAMRDTRAADGAVTGVITGAGAAQSIDWSSWKGKITHTELVDSLQAFHSEQTALFDSIIGADHKAAVASQTAGWELF